VADGIDAGEFAVEVTLPGPGVDRPPIDAEVDELPPGDSPGLPRRNASHPVFAASVGHISTNSPSSAHRDQDRGPACGETRRLSQQNCYAPSWRAITIS
jgi:hypothetical protein